MTIDTKRLATDAAYWDDCGAPEWSTKFGFAGLIEVPVWYNLESYQHAEGPLMHRVFRFANEGTYNLHQINGMIIRPQKPEVEWDGEGFPPVGCECEIANPMSNEFDLVEVLAHKGEWVIYWSGDTAGKAGSDWFRPIRTKEQRQRDELALLCDMYIRGDEYGRNLADAIIAAGWKKDV